MAISEQSPPNDAFGPSGLPEYAALLAARHAAHRQELLGLIADLWGGSTATVLDVACGDGFYSELFAEVLGPAGRVVAVDLSEEFLQWAARCTQEGRGTGRIAFLRADAERLPFGDAAFDIVFCAQSLISLPDPPAALREMRRVVRRGGTVAVLENDRFHELQIPWPAALEIAVRNAEWEERDGEARERPHAGRHLETSLHAAGLVPGRRVTLAIDRQVPLPAADEAFFQSYLHALIEHVGGRLKPRDREAIQSLSDPGSPDYLPARPDFWMTWTDVVVLAAQE